jgi:hypothetical protein
VALTDDPNDPRLHQKGPDGRYLAHLVKPYEERSVENFTRPLRKAYVHRACDLVTEIGPSLAATFAVDPTFYGSTFCVHCNDYFPIREFVWDDLHETPLGT